MTQQEVWVASPSTIYVGPTKRNRLVMVHQYQTNKIIEFHSTKLNCSCLFLAVPHSKTFYLCSKRCYRNQQLAKIRLSRYKSAILLFPLLAHLCIIAAMPFISVLIDIQTYKKINILSHILLESSFIFQYYRLLFI